MGERGNLETLGRYQIIKHLASGGMAQLLLASAGGIEGFERHVVIKKIHVERARDPNVVSMFVDEARLAASLHHANIVQVHDIGQEKGEYFFAMEYVHGEDLRRVLNMLAKKQQHMPLEHVITIIMGAAAALHYAHEHKSKDGKPLGIVHRDVSPANILVAYDGNVKVVDFGIAKAAVRSSETQSGTLKGKISYMAPEQCMGQPVDRRSDVFALGIVLFELFTVRRLFKGSSDFLTMASIVQGGIPRPSIYRPDIPPGLEAIIMKALAMSPDQRYATANEMRVALKQLAADLKLSTSNAELGEYMVSQFGRRPEPWLVDDDEAEIQVVEVDFDGDAAPIPTNPPVAQHLTPPPGSLLARARRKVAAAIGVPVIAPSPAPVAILPEPTGRAPATGSGTPMAWTPALPVVAPPVAHRRWLRIAVIATPVTILGIVLATRGGGGAGPASAPVAPAAIDEAVSPQESSEPAAAHEPAPPPAPAAPAAAPAPAPAPPPKVVAKKKPAPAPSPKAKKPAYDPHSLFIKKK